MFMMVSFAVHLVAANGVRSCLYVLFACVDVSYCTDHVITLWSHDSHFIHHMLSQLTSIFIVYVRISSEILLWRCIICITSCIFVWWFGRDRKWLGWHVVVRCLSNQIYHASHCSIYRGSHLAVSYRYVDLPYISESLLYHFPLVIIQSWLVGYPCRVGSRWRAGRFSRREVPIWPSDWCIGGMIQLLPVQRE